jgi:hypothetical protein
MRRLLVLVAALVEAACLVPNPSYQSTSGDSEDGGATGSTGGPPLTSTDAPGEPTTTAPTATTGSASGSTDCQEDADCDDGLFCNGAERCDVTAGCGPGAPPCAEGLLCQEAAQACATACEVDADADDDGHAAAACGGDDCDDGDPGVSPGATEVCDPAGVDEDCDPGTLATADADGDGAVDHACCNLSDGALTCGDDCDDAVPGQQVGAWAHCAACDDACGGQAACIAGSCVTARRVFASSSTHTANFGGVAGADAACQARADEAALGGSFRAYMVTLQDGFARLEQPALQFVRLDGVVVAADWATLAQRVGNLQAQIDVDEHGQKVGGNAWTGYGEGVDFTCDDWTTAEHGCLDPNKPCAVAGETGKTDTNWNGQYKFHCDDMYRLYCLEQ